MGEKVNERTFSLEVLCTKRLELPKSENSLVVVIVA